MGAVNVGVLSTTAVSARVNVKLYMMLGVVVFFILGVCGAILLGRIQDFVEYLFFTEQALEMPNRTACDLYIKNNTERVLGDDNVCVVLELTNLSHINNELGRVKGNEVLRRFADFIKEASATCGTVYYNGGWQFIGFFEQCRREDAESFADYMHRLERGKRRREDGIQPWHGRKPHRQRPYAAYPAARRNDGPQKAGGLSHEKVEKSAAACADRAAGDGGRLRILPLPVSA